MRTINVPFERKPLGQNNSQKLQLGVSCEARVSAKEDSTGLENETSFLFKHHHSVKKPQTASVTKRNLRERTRIRGVNEGFSKLRIHVPEMRNKSSKVETLKGAIEYIKKLKELLGEGIPEGKDVNMPSEVKDLTADSLNLPEILTSSPPTQTSSLSPSPINSQLHPMVFQLPETSSLHVPLPTTHVQHTTVLPPVSSLEFLFPVENNFKAVAK